MAPVRGLRRKGLPEPRCLHRTLPATAGSETPTGPGVRGAQAALGCMATVDLTQYV